MQHHHLKKEARNALYLGIMCFISYLAVYFVRNILSTVTPQMIKEGAFTEEHIGNLSAVFFACYAIGQLFNGIAGDKIKAKYMMSCGLLLAGLANIAFVTFSHIPIATTIAYGAVGIFLSMIYGPMTKVVSENVNLNYAQRCSIGFTFASFFGSPAAGMCAMFMTWGTLFYIGGGLLAILAILLFICFLVMEKYKIITYGKYKRDASKGGSIKVLLEHQIVKFTLIAAITGIIRVSVVFWLPTYISQHLNFSPKTSAMLFTIATTIISLSAFATLIIFELLKRDMNKTILLAFSASTLCFVGAYFIKLPILNILCMVLAILMSNCAASMLWSYYCPSLRDTGMVSSATGFLDFINYMAAALANVVFPKLVGLVGWGNLILIWLGIVVIGVIIALPHSPYTKKRVNY